MWSPGISSPCQTANSRLVADVASTLASERRRAAYSLEDSRPCDPTDQSTAGVVDPPSPGIRATPRDVGTDGRSLGSDRTLAPEARSAMAKYRGGASVEPPAPATRTAVERGSATGDSGGVASFSSGGYEALPVLGQARDPHSEDADLSIREDPGVGGRESKEAEEASVCPLRAGSLGVVVARRFPSVERDESALHSLGG